MTGQAQLRSIVYITLFDKKALNVNITILSTQGYHGNESSLYTAAKPYCGHPRSLILVLARDIIRSLLRNTQIEYGTGYHLMPLRKGFQINQAIVGIQTHRKKRVTRAFLAHQTSQCHGRELLMQFGATSSYTTNDICTHGFLPLIITHQRAP